MGWQQILQKNLTSETSTSRGAGNLFCYRYNTKTSYASVGYFKKFVNNFIGTSTELRPINGADGLPLRDPSANPRAECPDPSTTPYNPACLGNSSDPIVNFSVTTPSNLEDAEIDGWEFAVQHMLESLVSVDRSTLPWLMVTLSTIYILLNKPSH